MQGSSGFNFLRNHQTVLHGGCPVLSHQECPRVPLLHIPTSTQVCCVIDDGHSDRCEVIIVPSPSSANPSLHSHSLPCSDSEDYPPAVMLCPLPAPSCAHACAVCLSAREKRQLEQRPEHQLPVLSCSLDFSSLWSEQPALRVQDSCFLGASPRVRDRQFSLMILFERRHI